MTPATAERLAISARAGWRSRELGDCLTALYPRAPRLVVGPHVYRNAVWPAPPGTRPDEALLSGVEASEGAELAAPDATYRGWLAAIGAHVWNGATYTLRRRLVGPGGAPGVALGLGRFFEALDTCDVLAWELLTALGGEAGIDARDPLERLPRRRALHEAVADPLSDGRGRSAALAVATLVAFRAEGRIWLLVRRRSDQGNARLLDVAHVLPSGMFQPRVAAPEAPPSAEAQVYCELLEELYGLPEAEATRAVYGPPARCSPHLRALRQAGARLELTGLSVDLLSLRPELVTLLWIPRESWYRAHQAGQADGLRTAPNDEWGDPIVAAATPMGAVPFEADLEAQLASAPLEPADLAPNGAAAFWLGHQRLTRLVAEEPTPER